MPLTPSSSPRPSILGTRTHHAPSRSATPSTYQIKKRFERVLHHDLGGYTSGDETKWSITQTGLNVVKAGTRDRTISSSAPSPSPPLRAPKTGARPVAPQSQEPALKQHPPGPKPILFYHAHDPHYGFTNFSSDPVEYQGKIYPTSEHLFQSLKFLPHRPELAEHMRIWSKRPRAVFDEAHRFSPEVRPDWLKDELLSTGDAELVEDSDKDAFWGVGPDGKGGNQLGKALQRLRTKLRDVEIGRGKTTLSKIH
ncbi:hypothetical protein SCLCIDRAFT_913776 [Scleroderma citrinum Foug A]|uniref:NADAR domain-containing protein n=1 Tax=Scleroderma citrinum Foug A TaxID=1036808 RepID=A0A0C3A8S7_9AGAM|nr:hypothetical protein SCLCIDRAFT_913776 [Scleroderma citrinum Foug A]